MDDEWQRCWWFHQYFDFKKSFQKGLFNYGQDIVTAFSPPVVCCLAKKGLQKGSHGHPRTPVATPMLLTMWTLQIISAIYPSELQLTDISKSSTEVCYLNTNMKTGGTNTPFRISIYDKIRIFNFPHMDSNIPTNPAYGVYISQLVRYARICTSKVDFMNRVRGFYTNLLQKSFNKFFNRHGLIVVRYGATLREMRVSIQAWIAPPYPFITYSLLRLFFQLYLGTCARAILFCARALFINLIDVCI